ncbi:hypothetical protein G4B88_005835 [Cannabis sativa]|uniref:Zinc knuckle CX2CX4HX4C domain-containing protein n=1 Tax=Cannabis sativa TaxID=3483 RepID=A0A7J6G3E4_CANSA|nr:hypothetical protein G4B88_005835 [Cannabis sativa]
MSPSPTSEQETGSFQSNVGAGDTEDMQRTTRNPIPELRLWLRRPEGEEGVKVTIGEIRDLGREEDRDGLGKGEGRCTWFLIVRTRMSGEEEEEERREGMRRMVLKWASTVRERHISHKDSHCEEAKDEKEYQLANQEYLRVRVWIDVRKPIKCIRKISTDQSSWYWVNFKYEKLPTFCFICGIIGHAERFCPRLFEKPLHLHDKPYGLELRASNQRRQSSFGAQWLHSGAVVREEGRQPSHASSVSLGSNLNPIVMEEIVGQIGQNHVDSKRKRPERLAPGTDVQGVGGKLLGRIGQLYNSGEDSALRGSVRKMGAAKDVEDENPDDAAMEKVGMAVTQLDVVVVVVLLPLP